MVVGEFGQINATKNMPKIGLGTSGSEVAVDMSAWLLVASATAADPTGT